MEEKTAAASSVAEKVEQKLRLAHARSNSTGKISGFIVRQPVLSRYLRASVGSCHELCKGRMRHGLETKDINTMPKKESAALLKDNVNGENVGEDLLERVGRSGSGGNEEDGAGRATVKPKIGKGKALSPRSGADPSKGHVSRATKRVSLMQAVSGISRENLRSGKTIPNGLNLGVSSNEGSNEKGVHSSEMNPTASDYPATKLCSSSMKKKVRHHEDTLNVPKLTPPPPESKNIKRTKTGRILTKAPSLLSISSQFALKSTINGDTLEIKSPKKESMLAKGKMESGNKVRKVCRLEDKDYLGKKLIFKRGKSLEHQSENSPRRLRFQRPMLLVESQIGASDAERKDFKRGELSAAEVKSKKLERIVLKHRDVEKRQVGRRLFNNVIEETASKLVKTRKGKVKALVGAFETVISLQDQKMQAEATVAAC